MNRFIVAGLLPIVLFTLAGCGGSSTSEFDAALIRPFDAGSPDQLPRPRAGFADATTVIGGGERFEIRNSQQLSYDSRSTYRPVEGRDVTLDIGSDGRVILVTVGGKTYPLEFDQGRASSYRYDDFNDSVVLERVYAANETLEYFYYAYTAYNETRTGVSDGSAGFHTIGYLTDPNIIDVITGTATYEGQMSVVVSGLDRVGFADGDANFKVDFSSGTFSGDAMLENTFVANVPIPTNLYVPPIRFSLSETALSVGQVSGNLIFDETIAFREEFTTEVGEPVNFSGQFLGAVYGRVADGIGGQVSGEFVDENGITQFTLQGGFAGLRQP